MLFSCGSKNRSYFRCFIDKNDARNGLEKHAKDMQNTQSKEDHQIDAGNKILRSSIEYFTNAGVCEVFHILLFIIIRQRVCQLCPIYRLFNYYLFVIYLLFIYYLLIIYLLFIYYLFIFISPLLTLPPSRSTTIKC